MCKTSSEDTMLMSRDSNEPAIFWSVSLAHTNESAIFELLALWLIALHRARLSGDFRKALTCTRTDSKAVEDMNRAHVQGTEHGYLDVCTQETQDQWNV